jgi:hypothetical protein
VEVSVLPGELVGHGQCPERARHERSSNGVAGREPRAERGDAEGSAHAGQEQQREAGAARQGHTEQPGELALQNHARGEHEQRQRAALAGG